MSHAPLDPVETQLIVEARLGRRPQDALEAAVVLEAWAGVPAQGALAAAEALMPGSGHEPQPSRGRPPRSRASTLMLLEGSAFLATVIAIACWAAPLATSVGAGVVERALMVALPLTLMLQWGLGRRFLDRPQGPAELAGRRWAVLAGAFALVAGLSVLLGVSGALAGLLTVTWIGGAILVRVGWHATYAATVVVATPVMIAGPAPPVVLGVTAGVTAVFVVSALRPATTPVARSAGDWSRTLTAAAIGAGLGVMLVLDRTLSWAHGSVPALALLPSAAASLWSAYHLRHLHEAIQGALAGVPASKAPPRGLGLSPIGLLLGALARLTLLAAVLSVLAIALTPSLGSSASGAGVLVGFALFALAATLAGLVEAMSRERWALLALGCACATEAAVRLDAADPFSGAGLVAGGTVAVVLLLPAAIVPLTRPASTLATTLWIP